jgi:hypothetical protein
MFSPLNTETPNPFRPALQYLLRGAKPKEQRSTRKGSSSSLDSDSDIMDRKTPTQTSYELHPGSIPLISISRSPSPYPRKNSLSNRNSETEDDDFDFTLSDQRPFLSENRQRSGYKGLLFDGGIGRWLFSTALGWQFYVGFLVIWVGGCGIGLTLMNRIILLSTLIALAR